MLDDAVPGADEAVNPVAYSGLGSIKRRSALFAVGAVTGKVIGLVMLPILTRLLMPSELGNLDVLMTMANLLIAALLLGFDVAALRLYFDQPTPAAQRTLLSTWFAMALVVTVSAALAIIALSGPIGTALFSSDRLQPAILLVAVAIVAGTVEVIVLTILRARGRAGWYATINVGTLIVYAIIATTLLKTWRADAASVIGGWAMAVVVAAVAGTLMLRHDLLGRPSRRVARPLLRLGLPLAPAVIATLVSEFLIRIILLRIAGPDQVAYFTVGNRFASVAALSLAVLQLAWVPRVYALGAGQEARARIGAEATWIVALVCGAVLVVAAGAREIVAVAAGTAYAAALPPLGFGLVAVVGMAVYLVASMPSALSRHTEDLAVATGAAAVLSVVGSFALAHTLRATGAAASLASGQFVAVAIVGLLGARRLPVNIEWVRLLAIASVTSAATMILVSDTPLLLRVAVAAASIAVIGMSVHIREGLRVAREALRR